MTISHITETISEQDYLQNLCKSFYQYRNENTTSTVDIWHFFYPHLAKPQQQEKTISRISANINNNIPPLQLEKLLGKDYEEFKNLTK